MNREEFSRRFGIRQEAYIKSICTLAEGENFSWVNYSNEHEIDNEGIVSHIAVRQDESSRANDLESFKKYIRFVTGQGFCVEVVVEWGLEKNIFHVAAWENEEFLEWPEEIKSAFIFQWLPVSRQEDLGIS